MPGRPGLIVVGLMTMILAISAAHAADTRVQEALEERGIPFEIDDDGDFRVVFTWQQDDRTQLVIISSSTQMVGDVEIREVRSAGFSSTEELPCSTARLLLSENTSFKIGAWETVTIAGQTMVFFTARVRADSTPAQLVTAAQIAGSYADELEKQLLGSDGF